MTQVNNLKSLGSKTQYKYEEPSLDILETVPNLHLKPYLIYLECKEFTSLCPKTGQPDMATLHLFYIPKDLLVESKSLKLYLFSFRQYGEFHEDVCNRILNDLNMKMQPRYAAILGDFNSRGGISIKPTVEIMNKTDNQYVRELITVTRVRMDNLITKERR